MELDFLQVSDGSGDAVTANIETDRSIGATVLDVDSVDNWPDNFIVTTGSLDADGYIDVSTMTQMRGHLNAGDIIIDGFEPGYTDQGNTAGQKAIVKQTTGWADRVANTLQNIATGWLPAVEPGESWTYASATTITVPSDATTKYSAGMLVKVSQSTGGTKYGVITNVAATLLTVTWVGGATLANEAINNPFFSVDANPFGLGGIQTEQYGDATVTPVKRSGGFAVGTIATGTSTGNISETGLGFQPKAVEFYFAWESGTTSTKTFMNGVAESSTSRFALCSSHRDGAGEDSDFDATKCIKVLTIAAGGSSSVAFAADFVSNDADGFTINITSAPASDQTVGYIAYA